MTGFPGPSTQQDVSRERPPGRLDVQAYPTLKKSLSASLSMSSRSPSRSKSPAIRDHVPEIDDQHDGAAGSPEASKTHHSLSLKIPKQRPAAEAALKALRYLPTPLLVLSSYKTIVLANEAMGRLLGLSVDSLRAETQNEEDEEELDTPDLLLGQSLSQIGVDMLQGGQRIWVSWEVAGLSPREYYVVLISGTEIPRQLGRRAGL